MSCPETNPCDPCNEYDNCGCTNPTESKCVTYTGGTLSCLGVANGENEEDILEKIDAKICDIGKVKIDANDTCPEYLFEKLEEGLNISITQTGSGCDKKIRIDAVEGGVPVDVNVKVSEDDTTSGYLYDKIDPGTYMTKTILNSGADEVLELEVQPEQLISADVGNQLTTGTDGGLMTSYTAPDGSETKVIAGTGAVISGTGTLADPYIVSTNPSIQVVRSCFDSVWRPITLIASSNPAVVYASGAPQYRYRHDGTIEFKGAISYTVNFGAYSTGDRKFTIQIGHIPTTCLTAAEQIGVADLKNVNYIDTPQASADQITQMYGYIIRKSAQNIIIEFQSSFTGATSKSIVVNFDGAISHPAI